jgi:hypothetical protein
MECPFFESQSRCLCRQDPNQLSPADIEAFCRRSRYVLCPAFNEAESVDLTGIIEDEPAF